MMRLDRFTRGTRREHGRVRRYQYARCGACLKVEEVNDTGDVWHPPEAIAKKLENRGWIVGKRAVDDRCPHCARPTPAPKGEDETMARGVTVPAPPMKLTAEEEASLAQMAKPLDIKVEPPREPTREERRRIIDALDLDYDTKAERYRGSTTDKSLAAALDMPWRWVSDLRAQLYGDHDRNEAEEQRKVNLRELYQRGEDLEAKALQLAGEVETWKLDLKKAFA